MLEKSTEQLDPAELAMGKQEADITGPDNKTAHRSPIVDSARVLLAEDDGEMRSVIALHLRRAGYEVTECRDGMELLDHLNGYVERVRGAEHYDLIISDIRMPGVFGLAIAEGATDYAEFPPMILITAFGDAETHRTAKQIGVTAVLDKPFQMAVLLDKARAIMAR